MVKCPSCFLRIGFSRIYALTRDALVVEQRRPDWSIQLNLEGLRFTESVACELCAISYPQTASR